jgi:pSer/pThr/pTyr-binding forkhead associated (FHA) protein
MSERLSVLAMRFHQDPAAFGREEAWPVLLWQTAPAQKKRELVWGTLSDYKLEAPSHDPLIWRIRKGEKTNAFGVGVTLGRTANNDISVDEPSISRFHAFFQVDEKTGVWHVVDAESFNGTWCEGNRLVPGKPAPLADNCQLKFGYVEMKFMLPHALEGFLRDLRGP